MASKMFNLPTGAFPSLHLIAVHDRDAGRIVAAVFEATKTIEQNGCRFRASDVTNYSTHIIKG